MNKRVHDSAPRHCNVNRAAIKGLSRCSLKRMKFKKTQVFVSFNVSSLERFRLDCRKRINEKWNAQGKTRTRRHRIYFSVMVLAQIKASAANKCKKTLKKAMKNLELEKVSSLDQPTRACMVPSTFRHNLAKLESEFQILKHPFHVRGRIERSTDLE